MITHSLWLALSSGLTLFGYYVCESFKKKNACKSIPYTEHESKVIRSTVSGISRKEFQTVLVKLSTWHQEYMTLEGGSFQQQFLT